MHLEGVSAPLHRAPNTSVFPTPDLPRNSSVNLKLLGMMKLLDKQNNYCTHRCGTM